MNSGISHGLLPRHGQDRRIGPFPRPSPCRSDTSPRIDASVRDPSLTKQLLELWLKDVWETRFDEVSAAQLHRARQLFHQFSLVVEVWIRPVLLTAPCRHLGVRPFDQQALVVLGG